MSPWIDTSLRDLAMEWLVGEWIDTYEIDIKNDIETCIISCMKRVTSPGSMHDTVQFFRLPFILSGFSVGSSKCKYRKVLQKRKEHH